MKKMIYLLTAALCMTFNCMACSDDHQTTDGPQTETPKDEEDGNENSDNPNQPQAGKTLVVYYSYTNNTAAIVNELQAQIAADVIRIEPAEKGLDYAANNYAIGSAQIAAIRENPDAASSYPAIDPVEVRMEDYGTVIVATPLWWSNMAAPMQTFLFHYGDEMADKHIGLIVSSASSGISGVEADAKRLVPDGRFFTTSLWIRSSQTSGSHDMIADWLKSIDYSGETTSGE